MVLFISANFLLLLTIAVEKIDDKTCNNELFITKHAIGPTKNYECEDYNDRPIF